MPKRMGDLKSAKSTVFGRRVPEEWHLIFYQLYRFQKMPKRIHPKFAFAADTAELAGFEITGDSKRPCTKYLEAIRHFRTPSNITDMRSWLDLIKQALYAFAAAERMLPFHESLKPGTQFLWNDELRRLFDESRSIIINEIEDGVCIFDNSALPLPASAPPYHAASRPVSMYLC